MNAFAIVEVFKYWIRRLKIEIMILSTTVQKQSQFDITGSITDRNGISFDYWKKGDIAFIQFRFI